MMIALSIVSQLGLPTEAYIAVEEVHDDGTPTVKTFEHVASEIGAEEAEEVRADWNYDNHVGMNNGISDW